MKTRATITLREALQLLDSGAWLDVECVTYDANRGTGGEWLRLPMAKKQTYMTRLQRKQARAQDGNTGSRRNPNHYQHSTRNLVLPNGEMRKVHIRLITYINGKRVL